MHGGDRQVMMVVVQVGQAVRQLALVVVIDIGERGQALAVAARLRALRLEALAQQVAQRLGTPGIALGRDEGVEPLQELRFDGDGDAVHG